MGDPHPRADAFYAFNMTVPYHIRGIASVEAPFAQRNFALQNDREILCHFLKS
jgi:hypothetical protein